jgi:hypothetical protein
MCTLASISGVLDDDVDPPASSRCSTTTAVLHFVRPDYAATVDDGTRAHRTRP